MVILRQYATLNVNYIKGKHKQLVKESNKKEGVEAKYIQKEHINITTTVEVITD